MVWTKFVFINVLVGLALALDGEPLLRDKAEEPKLGGPTTKKLQLVAKAGTKSYFKEDSNRNWLDSKKFCESMGMRLAIIKTSEEATALRNAVSTLGYGSDFWVDARESHYSDSFIWDQDLTALGSAFSYLRFSNQDDLMFWCIDLHVTSDSTIPRWTGFYRSRCSYTLRTLCES